MMSNFVFYIIVVIFASKSYSVQGEYHWQNYTGEVPENAIEGGYDENGDIIYIAQAYVRGKHLIVTSLYPNIPYVLVPMDNEVIKVESGIKILCGSQLPVEWLPASAEDVHVVLIGKNPVRGGYFSNHNYSSHVGRIFYDNEIKIGSILSFNLAGAALVFVHGDQVLRTTNYEVLIYGTSGQHRRRKGRKDPHRKRYHQGLLV